MSQESEIRVKEAMSASEDKRSMEVKGKVTWRMIQGMDRKMIGEGRGVRTWTGRE